MRACIFVYMNYMYIDHSSIYSSRLTRRLLQAGVRASLRRRKYRQALAALTLQASLRSVGVSLYSDKNTCKRACMHKAYVFMYLHVCVCTCLLTYAHRAGNSQGVCVCVWERVRVCGWNRQWLWVTGCQHGWKQTRALVRRTGARLRYLQNLRCAGVRIIVQVCVRVSVYVTGWGRVVGAELVFWVYM